MTLLVNIVSVAATLSFLVLVLGPAPDVRRILQTRTTGVTPLTPLVSLFTSAWIWSIYAYLDKNFFPLLVDNLIALVIAFTYTSIFYRFTADRAYAHKVFACFGCVLLVASIYAVLGGLGYTGQSRESLKNVFGYIGNAAVFVFFASPFENVSKVFQFRSGVFIPIVLVVAGAVNSVLWIVYSLLTSDWLIFVPNAGAFAIGSVQIALYFYFHPSKNPIDPADLEAAVTNGAAVDPKSHAIASPEVDYSQVQTPVVWRM